MASEAARSGDGAGDFQNAVVARALRLVRSWRRGSSSLGFVAQFAVLLDLARPHPALQFTFLSGVKTGVLFFARALDALANRVRNFLRCGYLRYRGIDGGDFDVEIDPVEDGPEMRWRVTLHLDRAQNGIPVSNRPKYPARTGIHAARA